eukprot:12909252-Prorocentrum_lima.AAC.1
MCVASHWTREKGRRGRAAGTVRLVIMNAAMKTQLPAAVGYVPTSATPNLSTLCPSCHSLHPVPCTMEATEDHGAKSKNCEAMTAAVT